MVLEQYTSNFHAEYDALVDEVQRASQRLIPERLQDWFAFLDGHSEASAVLRKLKMVSTSVVG